MHHQRNYVTTKSHLIRTGGQDKWSKTPWSFTPVRVHYEISPHCQRLTDSSKNQRDKAKLLLRSMVDWVLPDQSTILNKSRFYFATCDWLRVVESTAGREERFVSWWSTKSTRRIITLRWPRKLGKKISELKITGIQKSALNQIGKSSWLLKWFLCVVYNDSQSWSNMFWESHQAII